MEHPLWNPALWARFAAGTAVLLWLPGHLLAGRFLGRTVDGLLLALSTGLVLPVVYAKTVGWLGVPFAPLPYLGFVAALGAASLAGKNWRPWARSWGAMLPAGPHPGLLAVAFGVAFALSVAGNGRYAAPPHVHDASNHAWITARVAEAQSLEPAVLAGEGPGFVPVKYAPGLHGSAALITRLTGVPAYVSVWMQTILFLALSPLAWTLAWRAWGFSRAAVSLALAFSVANPLTVGVLGWGGFGQVIGFFLVPTLGLLLAAAWKSRSRGVAIAAGLALGAQAFLHFSEVVVAPVVAFLVRKESRASSRTRVGNLLCVLALALAVALPTLWPLAGTYGSIVERSASETKAFGDALERWTRAGGRDVLQALMVLGLSLGLYRRSSRPVALVSLGLGLWYLALQSLADPVSSFLAAPFYRQAPRLLYLQFFFLPPLMALALLELHRLLQAKWSPRLAGAVVGAVLAAGLVPNLQRVHRVHGSLGATVPFDRHDVDHALRMRDVVGEEDAVINLWDDGSTWAMHLSRRRFVLPASWEARTANGAPLHAALRRLPEKPWPRELAEWIEREDLHWLYVSDKVLGGGPAGIRRADFEGDPRFEPRLVGENSTLFRVIPPTP